MLFIFHIYLSHLIIPVGRIQFWAHFAIQVSFTVLVSEKLVVGLDNYDLKALIIFHNISKI